MTKTSNRINGKAYLEERRQLQLDEQHKTTSDRNWKCCAASVNT